MSVAGVNFRMMNEFFKRINRHLGALCVSVDIRLL